MAHQVIVSVGKRHDATLADAIDQYTARLDREVSTTWHFIKPSGADETTARRLESAAVLDFVRDGDFVVLCDERGLEYDSVSLAGVYESWITQASRIIWVIGGAYGVDTSLSVRADVTFALSKLVFPHQLARLVLVEQLYRARMITKNHPYHHS